MVINNQKISLVIIDDHPLFRQGVGDILSLEDDFVILGYSSNGPDGLKLILSTNPDVAIVDVNLPGMNGQALATRVALAKVKTRLILLTAYDDNLQRLYAMRLGVSAYCTKDVQPEQLLEIIRGVYRGYYYVSGQKLTASELQRWLNAEDGEEIVDLPVENEMIETLSPREMEVLTYLTQGYSNKEIAQSLGISHQTVKNHVTAVMRKIGVGDRTQAALYALKRGWVQLHKTFEE